MKRVEIKENSPISLEERYISLIKKFLIDDPSLPFYLEEDTLRFFDYTVGEMLIDDLVISIKPRNPSFSLATIFEMSTYINNENHLGLSLPGFSFNSSFGIKALSENFAKTVQVLLNFGLTGEIVTKRKSSFSIKGKIILDKYSIKALPIKGIDSLSSEYTINTLPNQVIKSALLKLLIIENDKSIISQIFSLLREFDAVDEFSDQIYVLDAIKDSFFSANPFYSITLEYAIAIIKDLRISFTNGKVQRYAFLENSNDLFEKYIFKLIKSSLGSEVEKWKLPRPYAKLRYNGSEGTKYFSPDILIDYSKKTNSCRAVFDVKNKKFDPNRGQLSDLVNPADIYQLLFYCRRLKAKVGALVFPTSSLIPPLELMIEEELGIRLYLLSIDMIVPFNQRSESLLESIKKILKYS